MRRRPGHVPVIVDSPRRGKDVKGHTAVSDPGRYASPLDRIEPDIRMLPQRVSALMIHPVIVLEVSSRCYFTNASNSPSMLKPDRSSRNLSSDILRPF